MKLAVGGISRNSYKLWRSQTILAKRSEEMLWRDIVIRVRQSFPEHPFPLNVVFGPRLTLRNCLRHVRNQCVGISLLGFVPGLQ